MNLKENEILEDLEYKGFKIIQNKNMYRFNSDSIFLANSVSVKSGSRVLDMGTGSSIIATIIAMKSRASEVIGIDIQNEFIDMATRTAVYNKLEDKLKIVKCDIKDCTKEFANNSFDIITINPPFAKAEVGKVSENEHFNICRREIKVSLEEIISNASKLLKFGGKFYIINKANRFAEVVELLCKYKLTPKIATMIYPKENKNADTFILECKKGAKHYMDIKKLIVYDNDNNYTKQAREYYDKESL